MKKFLILLLLAAGTVAASAQDKLYADEFPLGHVTLLDGPLKRAQDLNVQTLLQYDCDRLLAPYRKEAGLEPKAKPYPNWDGLDGHVGGHYLSAMAMNAARGNEECRRRMEYMIAELKECADANAKNHPDWGKGYVGGMPDSDRVWSTFKKGDFRAYFGAWAPFYNLHKMFAGLRDAWIYCDNFEARRLYKGFCDWVIDLTADLSDEQMEQIMGNEHGGMNEVLADAWVADDYLSMSFYVRDPKYITMARRFSHRMLLTPMSQHVDNLDNLHANTQVPKAIGFARIGELCEDENYYEAASFFWETVTGQRSLAFGGNSRREHFPSKEACTDDYYELATFNHILSTQHPEHGGYVYFTPARPRHYRNYSAPNEAMWCCVGTGMENHSKYGQFIYTHRGNALYVNLFVASELKRYQGVTLRQETDFPYGETSRITITDGKGSFPLLVRYPGWVAPGKFSVTVNGTPVEVISGPGSYVAIDRKWKKGDVVKVSFPMHNSVRYLPNVPQYIAFMHGPILLGMKTGTEDLAHLVADDSRFGQYASGEKLPLDGAPILIDNHIENLADRLQPVAGKPLHFTLDARMENPIQGELQPFFEIHDARYMMYWLALSEKGYKDYLDGLARAEQERRELEARTVDKVQPGEQQPETDHRMETDGSMTGNNNDVFYRDARDGHFFSYLMQTGGRTDLSLRLKFWGVGEWKTHEFDIFVDDVLLTSINNTGKYRISEFKYETFPIPAGMLEGKELIRVKFVAKPGRQVGEIYGVRLMKD